MPITVTFTAKDLPLKPLVALLKTPVGPKRGAEMARRFNRVVAQEFSQGGGFGPGGGVTRWRPTEAFGTRPAVSPPLGGPRGKLARAWRGGVGSSTRIRRNGFSRRVSLVYAALQRGGAVTPSTARTLIKAKRRGPSGKLAMVGFVGAKFGVHMSEAKALAGVAVGGRAHVDMRAPQYVAVFRGPIEDAVKELTG